MVRISPEFRVGVDWLMFCRALRCGTGLIDTWISELGHGWADTMATREWTDGLEKERTMAWMAVLVSPRD